MSPTATARFKLLLGSMLAMLLGLLGTLPALHSAPVPKQGVAGWEDVSTVPVCFALPQDETRKSPGEQPLALDCDLNATSEFDAGATRLGSAIAISDFGKRSTPRCERVRGPPVG